ncbi:hypothetical protein ACIQYG_20935 [Peribacillus sp. NPDC096622]|uniref:hypothetical protein n=1 Tax=Peribacillus sp. NPDC096622 TaxID=3364396 RepID=UPI003805C97B
MRKLDRNKKVISKELVHIHLVGKYKGRIAITDISSYLKYRIYDYTWFSNKKGYVYAVVNGRQIMMHRLITNFEGEHTDHIENTNDPVKDKLNNVSWNLRVCSNQQNQQNARLRVDSSTGYKGVSLDKLLYKAQAKLMGKKYYFGGFNVIKYPKALEMAGYAYDVAADYLYGEFAEYNKVKESGLLSNEEMKIVKKIVHSKIKKHGLPKYQAVHKVEINNKYTGTTKIDKAN